MTLTDESPMPFGRYKDVKMQDVPAEHLLTWFELPKSYHYSNGSANYHAVRNYVVSNLDTITSQANKFNQFRKSI